MAKTRFETSYKRVQTHTSTYNVGDMQVKDSDVTITREVKPKTFRQSEQGIFNLVTSLSTYIIVMLIIVLAGTTTYYSNNKESLTWIDDNGEFIETSYYRNNDTSINDLNGLTLNEVYLDANILPNPYFTLGFGSDGLPFYWSKYSNASVSYNEETKYMEVNTSNGSLTNFYDTVDITCGDVYYISMDSYYDYTSGSYPRSRAVFRQANGSWSQGFDFFGTIPGTIHSLKHDSGLSQCKVELGYLTDDIGNSVYVKQPYVINLTDLGLENVDKEVLDEYLQVFKNYTGNHFQNLGSIPVSNYSTLGQVITSVVETMDAFLSGWIDFYETILSIF